MNSSPEDFDSELRARFQHEHQHLPDDPFVVTTERRIAGARQRRSYAKNAVYAGAVAVLVLGAPWLIEASAFVSTKLNAWFTVGFDWFAAPLGTIVVLVTVIAVAAAVRWRSYWLG